MLEENNMIKFTLLILCWMITGCAVSTAPNVHYSYGSAIILVDGTYYNYYCSTGSKGWDDIRMIKSADKVNWTQPVVVLTSTNPGDVAACDPSVIKLGEYYYMYYSGLDENLYTANYVARALHPEGPFQKYSSGVWDSRLVPSIIVRPKISLAGNPNQEYGAGQPSVVNVNGVLYQWYTDTTYEAGWCSTLLIKSIDGVTWTEPVKTSLGLCSNDVKYNAATHKFNLYGMAGSHTANVELSVLESADGITFHTEILRRNLPPFSHNIGVSGDEYGNLILDGFITFGAPQDFSESDRWGYWDMYMIELDTGSRTQIVRNSH